MARETREAPDGASRSAPRAEQTELRFGCEVEPDMDAMARSATRCPAKTRLAEASALLSHARARSGTAVRFV